MSEYSLIARWFLSGGALLAVVSLILWFKLPIPLSFPPFLATALLALGYGGFCWWRGRAPVAAKP